MRSLLFPCLLLFGAVAAHAQSATTFQLPPEPDATSTPQAQGPTDLEGTTRTAPRVIVEPTPTPSRTPTAQPSPRPSATPTERATPQPTRTPAPDAALPATNRQVSTRDLLTETPTQSSTASDTAEVEQDTAQEPAAPDAVTPTEDFAQPSTGLETQAADPLASKASRRSTSSQPVDWVWIAAGALVLIALLASLTALLKIRRRRSDRAEANEANEASETSLSSRPVRAMDRESPPAVPVAGSIEVEAHVVTLSRSVMNATISYRLTMVNRGPTPISDIRIGGDITTAHGRVPAAQQLADIGQTLPELHTLAKLDPGQRTTVQGELRLPLRDVRPLRQGNVPVFVPLLRLTVRASDIEPRAHTYVIGSKPIQKDARPNPFRLDEPPRSYAQLTTRAVA